MTETDLPAANELRRLAGWNQTEEDCRRLLRFAPQGCFVATEDRAVVGTVTTTIYGPELAWIGMMLVHPDYRRRGIATRLMSCAVEHLRDKKIMSIKLDATPAGLPLYTQLGFRVESNLTRWQCASAAPSASHETAPLNTRDLQPGDWSAIEHMDAAGFGVRRGFLLKEFARASVKTAVWPEAGPVRGWGFLRAGAHSDYLGPVEGVSSALPSLIPALLARAETRITVWDIPNDQASAIRTAERLGFEPLRPLTRMRLGPELTPVAPRTVFGIVDPAVG